VPAGKEEVKIFPNPNRGSFTVDLSALPHTKPITVQVYSVAGREVFTRALTPSDPRSLQIDLGGNPAGVYMVKILSGNTVWGEKVIVGDSVK
jgi:hypothetical protein